jgi:3',5'-cyclic-nucleotide phosphodiesterase
VIVRVLGCSGGEAPGRRASSVLLDGRVLLDAGAAASTLGLGEQAALEAVLLTHAHLDHVKELPLFCESRVASGTGPLSLLASAETLAALRAHLMNDRVYPDWTRVPAERPALRVVEIAAGRPFHVAGLEAIAVPLEHPGGSLAFLLAGAGGTLAWAGDTGPAPGLRDAVLRRAGVVRALALEVSFPDRLTGLARATGHLTPALFRAEIESLGPGRPEVWVQHLKPAVREETLAEIRGLGLAGVRVLEAGDRLALEPGEPPA